MKRVKPKKEKQFKGCVKIPLDTGVTFDELLARSTWYGDWFSNRHTIFSANRKWVINSYIHHLNSRKVTLETFKTSRVNVHDFKVALNYIINEKINLYDDIDFNLSYITISC